MLVGPARSGKNVLDRHVEIIKAYKPIGYTYNTPTKNSIRQARCAVLRKKTMRKLETGRTNTIKQHPDFTCFRLFNYASCRASQGIAPVLK